MPTPAQVGAAIELRVVHQFRRAHWHANRTPGSRGPFDVIALKPGPTVALIQVKGNMAIDRTQWNSLLRLATMLGAVPVWAWNDRQGHLHYLRMLRPKAEYQRAGATMGEEWTP